MAEYDKARDHYDNLLKPAYYLSVAHAGGLVGCLSILKDYQNVLQFHGVGIFIYLFGGGLIAAIFLYGSILIGRMELLSAILARKPPTGIASRAAYWLSTACAWISITVFVCAVVLVMYRFGSL